MGGVGSARNAGLTVATGDYVAFLDADDIWLPAVTDIIVQSITDNRCDIVAFAYCIADEKINRFCMHSRDNKIVLGTFENVPMYHHSSYLYKRQFLRDNDIFTDRYNGLDYNFRYNEDVRFLIQCYAYTASIQCISVPIFAYRNNPHSVTHASYAGEKVLIAALNGYKMLADYTNNDSVRSTCFFYLTRYFLELLEFLSMNNNPQRKALAYYDQYKIGTMIEAGYASEYSKRQYSLWRNNPQLFWHKKKVKMIKQKTRIFLGKNRVLRELYHRKKYPIEFDKDYVKKMYDNNSIPDS